MYYYIKSDSRYKSNTHYDNNRTSNIPFLLATDGQCLIDIPHNLRKLQIHLTT